MSYKGICSQMRINGLFIKGSHYVQNESHHKSFEKGIMDRLPRDKIHVLAIRMSCNMPRLWIGMRGVHAKVF